MICPVPIADLVHDAGCVQRQLVVGNGRECVLRLVTHEDVGALGRYFDGLLAETRRRYGPHALTREEAERICADIDYGKTLRFLAEANGEIVAYFIVAIGFRKQDQMHYKQYGLCLDGARVCTLAPSVADDWQNTGLGSAMMREIMALMPKLGFRWMVLWGGTQAVNARAVHFYEKFGFRRVGVFQSTVADEVMDNYDMVLELGAGADGAIGASEGVDA